MPTVTRAQVVQACLDLFDKPRYLEIGVWKGKTLFPVKASSKVGVDPVFAFDVDTVKPKHPNTVFFSGTSDEYFASLDPSARFEVIYLDGLHLFEQILRDLINSLSFLTDDGIIVIDDVCPTSYHSSLANPKHVHVVKNALKSDDKNWMGDVYKIVFFIDSFLQQYKFRTVSNNHGQVIIWRGTRETVPQRSLAGIATAQFDSIFVEADAFRRGELSEIVAQIADDRTPRAGG